MTLSELRALAQDAELDSGAEKLREEAFPGNEPQWNIREVDRKRRTREPALARALLALLPFVTHLDRCKKWEWPEEGGEPFILDEIECTCGLDSALSSVPAAGGGGG